MVPVLNQQVQSKKLSMCLVWFLLEELVRACKKIAVTLTWQSSGLPSSAAEVCLVASLGNAGTSFPRLAHHLGTGWGLHPMSVPQCSPRGVWRQHRQQRRHTRTTSCMCVLVVVNFSRVDNAYRDYKSAQVCKCIEAHHISSVKVAVGSAMLPLRHVPSVFSARRSLSLMYSVSHQKSLPKTGQWRYMFNKFLIFCIRFSSDPCHRWWEKCPAVCCYIPAVSLLFQGEGPLLLTFFSQGFQQRAWWFWMERI